MKCPLCISQQIFITNHQDGDLTQLTPATVVRTPRSQHAWNIDPLAFFDIDEKTVVEEGFELFFNGALLDVGTRYQNISGVSYNIDTADRVIRRGERLAAEFRGGTNIMGF